MQSDQGLHALFNQRDINIHVGINDTPFSYASVDFPRTAFNFVRFKNGGEREQTEEGEGDRVFGVRHTLFNMSLWLILGANYRPPAIRGALIRKSERDISCSVTNYERSR